MIACTSHGSTNRNKFRNKPRLLKDFMGFRSKRGNFLICVMVLVVLLNAVLVTASRKNSSKDSSRPNSKKRSRKDMRDGRSSPKEGKPPQKTQKRRNRSYSIDLGSVRNISRRRSSWSSKQSTPGTSSKGRSRDSSRGSTDTSRASSRSSAPKQRNRSNSVVSRAESRKSSNHASNSNKSTSSKSKQGGTPEYDRHHVTNRPQWCKGSHLRFLDGKKWYSAVVTKVVPDKTNPTKDLLTVQYKVKNKKKLESGWARRNSSRLCPIPRWIMKPDEILAERWMFSRKKMPKKKFRFSSQSMSFMIESRDSRTPTHITPSHLNSPVGHTTYTKEAIKKLDENTRNSLKKLWN